MGDEGEVTPGWRFVSIGLEGDAVDLGGINPWKASWAGTGQSIVVGHPSYPWQRHDLPVYTAEGPDGPVTFAAGEYSNGVWGFFAREGVR